jgi:hypothetical protein
MASDERLEAQVRHPHTLVVLWVENRVPLADSVATTNGLIDREP